MKISFAEPDLPRSGAVVAGMWEEGVLTPAARRLDEATGGAVARALAAAARFSGKKDELLAIVGPAKLSVSRIVLAGLGKPEAADARVYAGARRQPRRASERRRRERGEVAVELGDGAAIGGAEAAAQLALRRAAARLSLRQVQHEAEARAEADLASI